MFHGVSTPWPAVSPGLVRRVSQLYGLNQQLVLSPGVPDRLDLCKNLRMSPWGATMRLINYVHDTGTYYRAVTDWKTEGFSTCERGCFYETVPWNGTIVGADRFCVFLSLGTRYQLGNIVPGTGGVVRRDVRNIRVINGWIWIRDPVVEFANAVSISDRSAVCGNQCLFLGWVLMIHCSGYQ